MISEFGVEEIFKGKSQKRLRSRDGHLGEGRREKQEKRRGSMIRNMYRVGEGGRDNMPLNQGNGESRVKE